MLDRVVFKNALDSVKLTRRWLSLVIGLRRLFLSSAIGKTRSTSLRDLLCSRVVPGGGHTRRECAVVCPTETGAGGDLAG